MSFGNVVVAVNVGGIDEIVEHGISGFLLDADLTEQELHARIGEMIAEIASGSLASIELRMEAVRSALSFSWHDAASQFAALVQPERGLR
jgi:glycosyltransferase involved in cell wall biosynthesis